MENNEQQIIPEEGYTPRPTWQVWAARVGLILFLILVAFQVISIARGGM